MPHSIVRQMALTSIEFGCRSGMNLRKAGLMAIPSEMVKLFRVAESPVQMECVVEQILPLSEGGWCRKPGYLSNPVDAHRVVVAGAYGNWGELIRDKIDPYGPDGSVLLCPC
ncbi:MAG: hypothetical protein R2792_08085 [Saprospiraceae bacterium]